MSLTTTRLRISLGLGCLLRLAATDAPLVKDGAVHAGLVDAQHHSHRNGDAAIAGAVFAGVTDELHFGAATLDHVAAAPDFLDAFLGRVLAHPAVAGHRIHTPH